MGTSSTQVRMMKKDILVKDVLADNRDKDEKTALKAIIKWCLGVINHAFSGKIDRK